MSFLSSLKIAEVEVTPARKDPVDIAVQAFTAKIDIQIAYAKADAEGKSYTPPHSRKEPAKRDLDLRWYRKAGDKYVTVLKVGRLPITNGDRPVAYDIGRTLDDVISFFVSLRKAASDRDPELVSEIMAAKAAQAKSRTASQAQKPAEIPSEAAAAEGSPSRASNARKR